MTQAFANKTTLLTSLALLMCTSIVFAQDNVNTIVGKISKPANESGFTATKQMPTKEVSSDEESIKEKSIKEKSTHKKSAEENADKLDSAKKQPNSGEAQARPGERVTNPDHEILNSDTLLGGGDVNGPGINDYGYSGPGDMRTHLWNGHSNELIENGITENKLMAMTVPEVQKWHNHFHGVEGSPEHDHEDGELNEHETIVSESTVLPSQTVVNDSVDGTIVYENSGNNISGYPEFAYGDSEIIYEQGIIIEETMPYEFETQMESYPSDQGVIYSELTYP